MHTLTNIGKCGIEMNYIYQFEIYIYMIPCGDYSGDIVHVCICIFCAVFRQFFSFLNEKGKEFNQYGRIYEQCTRFTSVWCAIIREKQYLLIVYSRWLIFAVWHFILRFKWTFRKMWDCFFFVAAFRSLAVICQSIKGAQYMLRHCFSIRFSVFVCFFSCFIQEISYFCRIGFFSFSLVVFFPTLRHIECHVVVQLICLKLKFSSNISNRRRIARNR